MKEMLQYDSGVIITLQKPILAVLGFFKYDTDFGWSEPQILPVHLLFKVLVNLILKTHSRNTLSKPVFLLNITQVPENRTALVIISLILIWEVGHLLTSGVNGKGGDTRCQAQST